MVTEGMHPLRHAVGAISFGFVALNLAIWSLPLTVLGLVRLVLPPARPVLSRGMADIYRIAVRCDDWWWKRVLRVRWECPDLGLDRDDTCIVVSNHRSWIDIFLIQSAIARKGPIVKFLAKRELVYVPLLGLIFVAFEFPMLKRAAANNETEAERGTNDRQRILDACASIEDSPGAMLSFAEGTRFSAAKHATRRGYRHLLPPKAGGLGALCEALRGRATAIIDLTLVYPEDVGFWHFLCGAVEEIQIHAASFSAAALADVDPREWLNARWRIKDDIIEQARQSELPD